MTLNGIDIASYQAGLKISDVPIDFVIPKATEGLTYVNPFCDGWIQAAISQGKPVGTYHYARPYNDATTEADFYVDNCTGYIGKAAFFLDFEEWQLGSGSVNWCKKFIDRVNQRTGQTCGIYLSQSKTNEYNWSSIADVPLWVAQYNSNNTTGFGSSAGYTKSIGAFRRAALWQFTSSGKIDGWSGFLDLDYYYGTPEDWTREFIGDNAQIMEDDMSIEDFLNANVKGYSVADMLYRASYDTTDPTGRDMRADTHDHVKWMAAKVTDTQDTVDSMAVELAKMQNDITALGNAVDEILEYISDKEE